MALTRVVTVVIHEMGHALAGLVLLSGVISIYIGSYGDPKKGVHFGIGRLKIHFRYNPLLWNHGVCVSNSTQTSLLRSYIFTLAGPLASLLTAITCLYLLISPDSHGSVKLIAVFLLFSSLQDFFQNIRPSENPILLYDGSLTYNDGQTLKLLRSYKNAYKELVTLNHFHTNGQVKKGIEFFEDVYSRKKEPNLLRMGMSLYMEDENYSKTIALFDQLKVMTNLTSDDYCRHALAHSHSDDHSKALELYNESLKMDPTNFYALNNRGYTLNIFGHYENAIKDFNRAIELDPKSSHAYNNRGLSKIKMGNETEGLGDIKISMEMDDKNSYAYKNLGIYHKDRGELEKAMEFFLKAKNMDPKTHDLSDLILEMESQIKGM